MPVADATRRRGKGHRRAAGEPSPWQPFAVAIVLLTIFAVLMAAGGVAGWWTPATNEQPIGALSRWCERVSEGWLREPFNTIGNAGFVVAGLAMFAVLARDTSRDRAPVNPFIGNRPLALLYASAVTLLGPGSMLMHASHTFLGAWLDNVAMVAFILVPVLYNLTLLGRWRLRTFARVYVVTLVVYAVGFWFLGADFGINFELFTVAVPLWFISEILLRWHDPRLRWASGLVGFAVAMAFGVMPWRMVMNPAEYWWIVLFWLPAVIMRGAATVRRSYLPWFAAGVAVFVMAYYVWRQGTPDSTWCRPDHWAQPHALWHLLCALATWCFFCFLRTERPAVGAAPNQPAPTADEPAAAPPGP